MNQNWATNDNNDEAASDALSWVEQHTHASQWSEVLFRRSMEAYSGVKYEGSDVDGHTDVADDTSEDRAGGNPRARLAANVVNAALAKITSKPIRPFIAMEASDGSASGRKQARLAQQFLDGVMHQNGGNGFIQRAELAAMLGTVHGVLVDYNGGEITFDHILDPEIVVDNSLDPEHVRQIAIRKQIAVDELAEMYPDLREEIHASPTRSDGNIWDKRTVEYYRIWRLPPQNGVYGESGEETRGDATGAYMVFIDGLVLEKEDWGHDYFPIALLWWNRIAGAFRAEGAMGGLLPWQEDVDYTNSKFRDHIAGASSHITWVPRGSKVDRGDMTTEDNIFVEYNGTQPPIRDHGPGPNPALLQAIAFYKAEMREHVGVSEMSTQGQGLTSHMTGQAQRTHAGLESGRQSVQKELLVNFVLSLADLTIKAAIRSVEAEESVTARYLLPDDHGFIDIDWRDVGAANDSYMIRLWATSEMMATPEGRMQLAQEMTSAGVMQPAEAFAMMADGTDMQAYTPNSMLQQQVVDMMIDSMLSDEPAEGETLDSIYHAPDEYLDMNVVMLRTQHALLTARKGAGIPEERKDMLEMFMTDAYLNKQKQAAQAATMAAEAAAASMPNQEPTGQGGA